jgi:hypothetical protein
MLLRSRADRTRARLSLDYTAALSGAAMSSILDRDPIGAFTRHTHAECQGAPEGPLSGLACGIKDIYDL